MRRATNIQFASYGSIWKYVLDRFSSYIRESFWLSAISCSFPYQLYSKPSWICIGQFCFFYRSSGQLAADEIAFGLFKQMNSRQRNWCHPTRTRLVSQKMGVLMHHLKPSQKIWTKQKFQVSCKIHPDRMPTTCHVRSFTHEFVDLSTSLIMYLYLYFWIHETDVRKSWVSVSSHLPRWPNPSITFW